MPGQQPGESPDLRINHQSQIVNNQFQVGPGRFELPTSRLSGVRSRQLSYEPLIQPRLVTQTVVPQLVRKSVYTHSISREQQKNRCFLLRAVQVPSSRLRQPAVKASVSRLSARVSKLVYLSQVMTTSSTDLRHSIPVSTPRQGPFSVFLTNVS